MQIRPHRYFDLDDSPTRKANTKARSRIAQFRVGLMLVMPLALYWSIVGPVQPSLSQASSIIAQNAQSPDVDPPSNLQVVTLDSTLHVNWTPSTDPDTQWHVLSIWDGANLQQSKVGGRTTGVMQANGLVPGRTYTVKVQAMNAQWQLSAPIETVATTDPQSPMRNAAFFENFNGNGSSHGPLDPNYFDIRTEAVEFEDLTDTRGAFNNENHWHSLLVGSGNVGGVTVRPRVPFDFTDRTGTIQFEVDVAAVQHSHGKWWSVHLTEDLPSLPSDFGGSDGEQFPNSVEFGAYKGADERTASEFNIPFIAVNINGNVQVFKAETGVMTAGNIRLPVVIRVSQTSAEMFINGVSVVRATGFNLPFTRSNLFLGHNNYGSDKVDWDQNPSTILQLIHWETLQFDGPAGSYNPIIRTYIQPNCDGTVDDGQNEIVGCNAFVDSNNQSNSFSFNINDANVSAARTARLYFYGSSTQNLTVNLNGNTASVPVKDSGGAFETINTYDFPVSWLQQGSNTLSVQTNDNDMFGLAQFEVEVVFNQPRIMPTPQPVSNELISLTTSNFRVEHIPSDPNVHTVSTYVYSLGAPGDVTYSAQILKGNSWLQISPSAGIVRAVALGGGMTRLDIQVDFANISDEDNGVIRIDGGVMPAFIGIFAIRMDERSTFTTMDPSILINTFNKGAIPDYYGGGPTPTTPPAPSPTNVAPTSTYVVPTATPLAPTATEVGSSATPAVPTATTIGSTATPVAPTATAGGPTYTAQPTSPATSTPEPTSPPTSTVEPTPIGQPTMTPWPNLCEIWFNDVPRDHWAWNYITYMACHEIVVGYPDGTFRPNNNVSRGQAAKIISNSAGFEDDPGEQLYEDVPPDSTFFTWINRLSNRGIMEGYPCGGPGEPCGPNNLPYFRPGNNTSRGQIAKLVSNTAGFDDNPGDQLFEDVLPGSTFYPFINRLASRDVMSGYPCETAPGAPCMPPSNLPYFMPGNDATRAQVAKIAAGALITP